MKGVVAAGHPLTADAGAQVLRAGGNAVDAALAAMATSFVAEPQLTGLGAGGYMLVAEPGAGPRCSTSSSPRPARAPTRRRARRSSRPRCSSRPPRRSSTSARRRAAPTGRRPGSARRTARYATIPLADLVAPAAALARAGVEVNAQQAYIFNLLAADHGVEPGGAREVLGRRPRRARGRRARATRSWPTRSSGSARRARRRSTPATSRRPPRAHVCRAAAGR